MKRKKPSVASDGKGRSNSTLPVVAAAPDTSVDAQRRANKRSSKKRKKSGSSNSGSGGNNNNKRPLNGLTLAVTTLDSKRSGRGEEDDSGATSYKQLTEKCRSVGANITSQVHKRVHALIVSDAAVQNATQRVRKALKLRIPIVDIGWIEACCAGDATTRVDWSEYLRDEEAKKAAETKKAAAAESNNGCDVKFDVSTDDADAASGWTEPVEYGCSCVCHENGDLECPWCTGDKECNTTKRRLGKSP